jgi:hypothetical protein
MIVEVAIETLIELMAKSLVDIQCLIHLRVNGLRKLKPVKRWQTGNLGR